MRNLINDSGAYVLTYLSKLACLYFFLPLDQALFLLKANSLFQDRLHYHGQPRWTREVLEEEGGRGNRVCQTLSKSSRYSLNLSLGVHCHLFMARRNNMLTSLYSILVFAHCAVYSNLTCIVLVHRVRLFLDFLQVC